MSRIAKLLTLAALSPLSIVLAGCPSESPPADAAAPEPADRALAPTDARVEPTDARFQPTDVRGYYHDGLFFSERLRVLHVSEPMPEPGQRVVIPLARVELLVGPGAHRRLPSGMPLPVETPPVPPPERLVPIGGEVIVEGLPAQDDAGLTVHHVRVSVKGLTFAAGAEPIDLAPRDVRLDPPPP